MATNQIGSGSKNLTVNVPVNWKKKLQAQADASGMRLGEYIRAIIEPAIENQIVYRRTMEIRGTAEDPGIYAPKNQTKQNKTDE